MRSFIQLLASRIKRQSGRQIFRPSITRKAGMPGTLQIDLNSISQVSSDSARSRTCSLAESTRCPADRPFVVAVEGNIGCGKSTLMDYFKNSDIAEVVPEPLHKWTNLNGHNALGNLYNNAKRWSFSFDTYATLTRVQMQETVTDKPVLLLERSLYGTRYCFVESLYRNGNLHEMEYEILCRWFNYLVANGHLPVDLIVYLRADPKKCYQRLRERDRKEEVTVHYSFIENLHNFHDSWLLEEKFPHPAPVLVLDANTDLANMGSVYEEYKSRILFGHT